MSLPLFFSLGGINVAIIDIVVAVILIIAIIIGLVKGFAKQVLGLLGFIAALVGAYFLCSLVIDFLKTTFPQVTEMVHGWILGIPGLGDIGHLTPENAQEILNHSTIPVFLHGLIISAVEANGGLDITPLLADWVMMAIVFVILVIILLILFAIIKKLFTWIANLKFIKPLDKILGMIFSVAVCVVVLVVVLILLAGVASEFITALLTPMLEDGTVLDSLTNKGLTFIMNLPFIQGLFG